MANQFKWYYRCEVKGIQAFIQRGNTLKELAGSSALIDALFTVDEGSEFRSFLEQAYAEILPQSELKVIYQAAGGATLGFQSDADLKAWITQWPLWIDLNLPGIQLYQAWISEATAQTTYNGNVIQALIDRLNQARNTPPSPLPIASPIVERSLGGFAAIKLNKEKKKEGTPIDRLTQAQLKAGEDPLLKKRLKRRFLPTEFQNDDHRLPYDHSDLADGFYLAVVHIDGNRIGKLLQNYQNPSDLKTFSTTLSQITLKAVQEACKTLKPQPDPKTGKQSPILLGRPVVVGGDDVTAVVRADRALDFVKTYCHAFETESKKHKDLFTQTLTASAGVSFVRKNHPFRDALHLAEDLCAHAKSAWRRASQDQGDSPSMVSFQRVTQSLCTLDLPLPDQPLWRMAPYCILDQGAYVESSAKKGFHSLSQIRTLSQSFKNRELPQGKVRHIADLTSQEGHMDKQKSFDLDKTTSAEELKRIDELFDDRSRRAQAVWQAASQNLKSINPQLNPMTQAHTWFNSTRGPSSPWVEIYELMAIEDRLGQEEHSNE